jgi:ribosome-binding factor A
VRKNDNSSLRDNNRPDRLLRVNELIKRELAAEAERLILPEPNMLMSVTEVAASVDLRHAAVFVSIFGGSAAASRQIFNELERHRCNWQNKLAKRLGFKHTPVLEFRNDERTASGDRVLAILNEAEAAAAKEDKAK